MTRLSQRIGRLKPSATVVVASEARHLIAAGHDIIDMSEGEPDLDTPEFVLDAAERAMRGGQTRYTNVAGTDELIAAIAEKFRRDNGLDYRADQIMASAGAKQIIFNALFCTLDAGDEVIIPVPSWVSYADIVTLFGGVPVLVACPAAAGFQPDPGAIERAITPRTRWLVLNSPNNPTGAVLGSGDLDALADLLRRHPHVGVITDDIYEHLVYGPDPFATIAAVAPDLQDRVLTVNGVSKSHAMTGWRIGFAGGHADLIAAMVRLQGQSITHPSSVAQAAAAAALTQEQSVLAERRALFRARRDRFVGSLGEIPGATVAAPEGAFYVYLQCSDMIGRECDGATLGSDIDIATHVLSRAGVAGVPGSAFHGPPGIRLCFAKPDDVLDEAARRLREAFSALAGKAGTQPVSQTMS